jgi:hypothetical protein
VPVQAWLILIKAFWRYATTVTKLIGLLSSFSVRQMSVSGWFGGQ